MSEDETSFSQPAIECVPLVAVPPLRTGVGITGVNPRAQVLGGLPDALQRQPSGNSRPCMMTSCVISSCVECACGRILAG